MARRLAESSPHVLNRRETASTVLSVRWRSTIERKAPLKHQGETSRSHRWCLLTRPSRPETDHETAEGRASYLWLRQNATSFTLYRLPEGLRRSLLSIVPGCKVPHGYGRIFEFHLREKAVLRKVPIVIAHDHQDFHESNSNLN